MGVQRRAYQDQDPASVKASELVGRFHDALAATGCPEHDLERFLVRIVFCLFADDTGVFEPRDLFVEFIESRTSADGADLGPWLMSLFQVLNTPEVDRPVTLDEDLARFAYINGSLFGEQLSLSRRAWSASLRVSPRRSIRNRALNTWGSKAGLVPSSRRWSSRRTAVSPAVNHLMTWNRSST